MIGPGTGVAPFRAFLHERMATKAPGRNWLFFGHQRRDYDFFYEDELSGMKAAGVLTRLSLAWSRDGDAEILRAGPHARGRPRSVGLARRRRARLCLRRRQAHGQGRRARADRHRGATRRALGQRGDRLCRRAEKGRPLSAWTSIDAPDACARSRCRPPSAPPAPIAASAAASWRSRTARGGAIITGDPDHPANFGRLCSKGSALGETLGAWTGGCCIRCCGKPTAAHARVDWHHALDQCRRRASAASSSATGRTRSRSISPGSC